MKNSRVQEPNVETDHLESYTSGSANLLKNQSFDPRFQPTRQDVCWSGGLHFFIKWSKTNQMGRCVERTKSRHMCPVPAMDSRPTENAVTVPLTPHPSSTSKMGEHSLPLHLSIPGMVELCGYNPAKYNTHIGAVAARTGLPTDTIWNLGRGEAKHTRHTYVGEATVHVN